MLGALAALSAVAAGADPASACPDTPHRLETFSVFAPALGRAKRIFVYLPPGYDCADERRYPVFYFNDGHDLFDWEPHASALDGPVALEITVREGWYGSWRLDRQLDVAIAEGAIPPLIVVGIASDDGMRSRDLAPVPWRGSAEARGDAYGAFVAGSVVPEVDRRYRTLRKRACRGIGGASLGGLGALAIGLAHRESFGMVLALSPLLADPSLAGHVADLWTAHPGSGSAIYIDVDDDALGRADRAWLEGLAEGTGDPVALTRTKNGRHTIASWSGRVMPALTWVMDRKCSGSVQ